MFLSRCDPSERGAAGKRLPTGMQSSALSSPRCHNRQHFPIGSFPVSASVPTTRSSCDHRRAVQHDNPTQEI